MKKNQLLLIIEENRAYEIHINRSNIAADAVRASVDFNWFPTRKAAWIAAGMPSTSVNAGGTGIPAQFTLGQNYPNPFNTQVFSAFFQNCY